ncbi:MAG: site-specific integrase, partial [Candidatus Eisenbacteria bacterium]|nr:site-specific integrase [Candidatus Eisenbacteria bacterium]
GRADPDLTWQRRRLAELNVAAPLRVMLLLESKMEGMPEDVENGRQEGALLPLGGVPEGERLVALVLDSVTSPESRRAYGRGLREFLAWLPPRPFTRASVQEYRAHLEASGRAPSTINLRLAPIRKLALEASDNGLLDPARAAAIARVKGVRRHGVRLGNWVDAAEAGRLLASPWTGSLRGKRDRAILAVLLGCALRRSELVALRMEDLQEREGRAVFADILGKGGGTPHRLRPAAVALRFPRIPPGCTGLGVGSASATP